MDLPPAARDLLLELKRHASASDAPELLGSRSRALRDIDAALSSGSTRRVRNLLLPTGNLQELAIENGWENEFAVLATGVERMLGIA